MSIDDIRLRAKNRKKRFVQINSVKIEDSNSFCIDIEDNNLWKLMSRLKEEKYHQQTGKKASKRVDKNIVKIMTLDELHNQREKELFCI